MSSRIADLPAAERPRERLAALGPHALSNRELLALILRNGIKGMGAVDLAMSVLHAFGGSVADLSRAHLDEIAALPGVGQAKAAAVVAAFDLSRRIERDHRTGVVMSPGDIVEIVRPLLVDQRRERVVVVVCDAAHRVKHVVTVSEGALDHALLPVREVLNAVLSRDGRAFAIAHNHPSNDPQPSNADSVATRRIEMAADLVGLRLLDHVIIAGDRWATV